MLNVTLILSHDALGVLAALGSWALLTLLKLPAAAHLRFRRGGG